MSASISPSYLSLSACCFLASLAVPSISFSLSLNVSLSAWAACTNSATLSCSTTLDRPRGLNHRMLFQFFSSSIIMHCFFLMWQIRINTFPALSGCLLSWVHIVGEQCELPSWFRLPIPYSYLTGKGTKRLRFVNFIVHFWGKTYTQYYLY